MARTKIAKADPAAKPPAVIPAPGNQALTWGQAPSPPGGQRRENAGGSPGYIPVMNTGMTFVEVGASGLRAFAGYVREEFLPQLQGRQAAQKYREMMDNNPIVASIMAAIVSTMRKVEWRSIPQSETPEGQEAAEFLESCMDDMSHTWEDLVVENLSMLGYGFAPHEIVYKRRFGRDPGPDPKRPYKDLPKSDYDDGLIGWRRMPIRGQDTVLKWFFDENGEIQGMTQLPYIGPMVDLPIEKMLLFRPSQHKNNPEGRSILRSAYVPYYFIKRMQEQEAILGERMGGLPVVKVPSTLIAAASAGNADAVAALAAYKRMAINTRIDEQMGIVMPSDMHPGPNGPSTQPQYSFELATPQGGRGMALNFSETIGRYNKNILTSVLADFIILGQEAHGTQSLATTKVDMFFQAIEGYLNSNASVYNRHAIPRLWRLNGFDLDNMPELHPDLAQRIDLDVLSNFVSRLAAAGMPMFPNEELQSFLMDAAGLPDVVDERALQAAGVLDEQLDRDDEMADAALDQAQNPPKPATPLQKMILASWARRQIRLQGPRFGINTRPVHKHRHGKRRR